ncbi:hypothetical protein ACH3XY_22385 [Streptomyces griseus]
MMEAPHLDAIRQSYDAVAADYARSVTDPAELDPLSRAVLAAFAEFHRTPAPGGHLLLVTRVGDTGHQRRSPGSWPGSRSSRRS